LLSDIFSHEIVGLCYRQGCSVGMWYLISG